MRPDQSVKKEIKLLRNADSARIAQIAEDLKRRRLDWFKQQNIKPEVRNLLDQAYQLLLNKLGIKADQAPIIERQKNMLVFHSKNFCPTLEACKVLGLDTRDICRQMTEGPTQALLQQLDSKLRFSRNYKALRPYTPYCEEMIILESHIISGVTQER